jgi:hypothetical protein
MKIDVVLMAAAREFIIDKYGKETATAANEIIGEVLASIVDKEETYGIPKEKLLAALVVTIRMLDELNKMMVEQDEINN